VYKVSLEKSYFSAQADTNFRALTIAKLLREQARKLDRRLRCGKLSTTATNGPTAVCSKTPRDLVGICVSPPGRGIAVFATNCPEWVLLELASPLAGLTLLLLPVN
jgi:fatty-acyl-CoA synthase